MSTAPGAADARPTAPSNGGGPELETAVVDRNDGRVVYRLSMSELDRVDQFSIAIGRHASVVGTDGLERRGVGNRVRFVPADGRTSGKLVVAVDAQSSAAGPEYVTGDDWSLTRVPYVVARWSTGDGTRHVRPFGDGYGSLGDRTTATFGDRYALVGEQTVRTYDAPGQRIRITRPAGTTVTAGTDAVAASLRAASANLRVGDRDESLTLFAITEPARRGGESFPARDEAWVRADSPVDSPNNVWVHEYVHTRQDFKLAESMSWFREASAEYYAARLTYEQGRISKRAMFRHLNGEAVTTPLTEPQSWHTNRVPYSKGARVLALLDRHIRQSTDGKRSLQDVFWRMNAHQGRVTYAEFKHMVSATAGHSMEGWLDRYVAGHHAVAGIYEPEPARSGVLAIVHAVLAGDRAVLTTLALATLLGALLSLSTYAAVRRLARLQRVARLRPWTG